MTTPDTPRCRATKHGGIDLRSEPMADELPAKAIDFAAVWLHDELCVDGDTKTCSRWLAPNPVEHIGWYRDKARGMLTVSAGAIREQAATAERQRLVKWMHAEATELSDDEPGLTAQQRRVRDETSLALVTAIAHLSAHGQLDQPQPACVCDIPVGAISCPVHPQPGDHRYAGPAGADAQPRRTRPGPYIDTLAAQHAQEFEPDDQENDDART